VDAQGLPVRLHLTAGQAHDNPVALGMLDSLAPNAIVLADRAYDTDNLRALIEAQGAVPNIPATSRRKIKPDFSEQLYRERNLVERFFNKLKHFRRIATRYDKLAENLLAMVQLASMRLWLRTYESTS
jgi:transposase